MSETVEIGKAFIRATRLPTDIESDQNKGMPQPPLTLPPDPSWALIDLPEPSGFAAPACDLRTAIENRRTRRKYRDQPLTLAELSYLLWATQGIREITARPATQRTVPSAGARHAFETYLLVNRVEGLQPGLYYFVADGHRLAAANLDPGVAGAVYKACLMQEQVTHSAATFIWVAIRYRMEWRYPGRGYRYLFIDAGHVCQNLYLVAESLDCGVCAIGAFDDMALNRVLGVDGEDQFAIYAATLGKKV